MFRKSEEDALMQGLHFAMRIPLLLVGLAFIQGCGNGTTTEAGDASQAKPAPLKNGTGVLSERMKGVIELKNGLDGTRCTGLLLNYTTILTTAHCAARLTRPGEHDEQMDWGIQWNTYAWDSAQAIWVKHCYNQEEGVCPDGVDKTETKDVHLFSLSMSPDNDLAIVSRAWYPIHFPAEDFAEIYLGDITPASTPRLQLFSWGQSGNGSTSPLPKPLTGTMKVVETTAGHVKLTADQIQGCLGDEGAPWTLPGALDAPGNAAVALESQFTPSGTTGCSAVNGTEYAVRLANKADWIRSVDSSCVPTVNSSGLSVLRCAGGLQCGGVLNGYEGCRGSGCTICSEKVDAFPKYFEHHRSCSRNTLCAGRFATCSSNCPEPTAADL